MKFWNPFDTFKKAFNSKKLWTAFILLAFVGMTYAQGYKINVPTTAWSQSTNRFEVLTTNGPATAPILSCDNQDNLGVVYVANPTLSNRVTLRLSFAKSVDGNYFDYDNPLFMHVECASNSYSAGKAIGLTNFDVKGYKCLKFFAWANTNYHGVPTNASLIYSTKK